MIPSRDCPHRRKKCEGKEDSFLYYNCRGCEFNNKWRLGDTNESA